MSMRLLTGGRRRLLAAGCVIGAVLALAAAAGDAQDAAEPAADARQQDVRDLIEHYFRSWSAKDIDRYGQCFMPQAAVQLLDQSGKLTTTPLRPFLEGQRESHRRSATGLTETAESVDIRFEARLARVVVRWKLVEGERTEFGYDHFTLMQSDGKWRIANLFFYATPEEEGPTR